MARQMNYEARDKVRFSITLPASVAEDIKRTAAERNVTASYFYTQLICEGFSHYRTQKAIESLQEDLDSQYLALELVGAKLDELVKFLAMRLPSPQFESTEQKDALVAKAEKMARNVSITARKDVQNFRTGASNVDPLGVEKLLEFFKSYIENAGNGKEEVPSEEIN